MGYMICTGNCIACGRLFSFNPERVPSIRVNAQRQPDPNGSREPVCQACFERANEIRKQRGLPLNQLMPGAYEPEECV